jgi:hypothetical protein
LQIGLLLEEKNVAKTNGNIVGYFLLKEFFDIFTYIGSFKNWFV